MQYAPASHLNEDAAKRAAENKITTDYVMPKAGTYFVKAVFGYLGSNRPKLESSPIQIDVNEPTGEDLEVWNRIKNNGELTSFSKASSLLPKMKKEKFCWRH